MASRGVRKGGEIERQVFNKVISFPMLLNFLFCLSLSLWFNWGWRSEQDATVVWGILSHFLYLITVPVGIEVFFFNYSHRSFRLQGG